MTPDKAFKAFLLLISMTAILSGCGSKATNEDPVRRYELKGRIESVDLSRNKVRVDHGDIKGYMDAMIMDFTVRDEATLRVLKAGDQITGILVYDSRTNLTWIDDIKVINGNPGPVK